jgi:hypothetical protein
MHDGRTPLGVIQAQLRKRACEPIKSAIEQLVCVGVVGGRCEPTCNRQAGIRLEWTDVLADRHGSEYRVDNWLHSLSKLMQLARGQNGHIPDREVHDPNDIGERTEPLDGPAAGGRISGPSARRHSHPTEGRSWFMTKAQQTMDRVDALVGGGTKKADAFKQLAEEYGQPVDSVRGAYYSARKAAGLSAPGGARRTGRRETTAQDAIASAVATLEAAIESIDFELETARERAAEAEAEYEAIKQASGGRIEEIRAKIAVLDPSRAEAPAVTKPATRKGGAAA